MEVRKHLTLALALLGLGTTLMPWLSVSTFYVRHEICLAMLPLGTLGAPGGAGITFGAVVFILGTVLVLRCWFAPLVQSVGLIAPVMAATAELGGDLMGALKGMMLVSGIGVPAGCAVTLAGLVLIVGPRSPGLPDRLTRRPRVPTPPVRREAQGFRQAHRDTEVKLVSDHLIRGGMLLERGDHWGALREYGMGLRDGGDDLRRAEIKVRLAKVLDLMGKHEEASQFLEEAREIDPLGISGWGGDKGPSVPA